MGEFKTFQVNVTTLDDWARHCSKRPQMLKLDLQGTELAALRGASTLLPQVWAAVVEVNFVPRYEGRSRFPDIASLMENAGLPLFRLYEIHFARNGRWQFADALFLRSS